MDKLAKKRGVTMDNQAQPLLVPFKCDKCGKVLAWALPEATVCCKQCGKWVNNSAEKNRENAITA
ncbi:MAG: hypothetical protein K0Q53_1526 [Massilibacillus sp.]|jgi:transcription elongation factor Elf1|nr:hypothetical protein [Massilibacillus sp.]